MRAGMSTSGTLLIGSDEQAFAIALLPDHVAGRVGHEYIWDVADEER